MKEVLKGIWPHAPLVNCRGWNETKESENWRRPAELSLHPNNPWSLIPEPSTLPNPVCPSVRQTLAHFLDNVRNCDNGKNSKKNMKNKPQTNGQVIATYQNKTGQKHTHFSSQFIFFCVIFVACLLRFALLLNIFHLLGWQNFLTCCSANWISPHRHTRPKKDIAK